MRTMHVIGALAVLLAGLVTLWGEASTQPVVPASAAPEVFSAERAVDELRGFATEPRPLAGPAGDRARDHLVDRLTAAGMRVQVQEAVGGRSAAGLATFGRVQNVVATRPGSAPTGALLLVAHYDSAPTGPGAADDGASVAAILETLRALGPAPLRNDLVVLLTDGEEDGLLGAEAFVREHPLAARGGVVLNWEARGTDGPSVMFETSPGNAGLVELFDRVVPHPRGDSSLVELYRALPNNSDFTALRGAGFTGLNSAFLEGAGYYHTAGDTVENLNPGSLQHHGETMLALTRELGRVDLPHLGGRDDLVHFRLVGMPVSYSAALVGPLAALAVLLWVGAVVVAVRRGAARAGRIAVAAVSAVLPLLGAAAAAQGLWSLLVVLRPDYDLMSGLLHRPLAYQGAVAALAAAAVIAWYAPLRRWAGATAAVVGAATWPVLLSVLAALHAPSAAFVVTLPAAATCAAQLVALLRPRWAAQATALAAVAAVCVLLTAARHALLGFGLAMAGAGALVLALLATSLLPLVTRLPRAGALLPVGAVATAVLLVAAGLVTDGFDAEHPRRSHLAYVLDADAGTAHWVSAEAEPTGWTRQFVDRRDPAGLPPGYARGELWTGPAEPLDVAGPELTGSREGELLRLRVLPRRSPSGVTLRLDVPISEVTATTSGLAPVTRPVSGTRSGTWPGEIRFRDLPRAGVDLTVRVPRGPLRVTAVEETHGLDAPGFRPRPADVVAGLREDGDLVAVTRTRAF